MSLLFTFLPPSPFFLPPPSHILLFLLQGNLVEKITTNPIELYAPNAAPEDPLEYMKHYDLSVQLKEASKYVPSKIAKRKEKLKQN